MTSIIKVDTIQDQDGNNIINENANTITIGASGDTITIPAGATFDSSAATNTLPATVVTTTGTQTLSNKTIDATQLTGTVATSNLGTGTADATTFLRGDQTYAAAGGGKVLQVVQTTSTTDFSTSSTSFVEVTTLSTSITPSFTSSKILVLINFVMENTGNGTTTYFTAYRNNTTNLAADYGYGFERVNVAGGMSAGFTITYLDSPNTTSSTVYDLYVKNDSGSLTYVGRESAAKTITLMEIAV